MKKILCFVSALLILVACQEKQYFTASPEIDVVKKANDAYFAGDWNAFKSVFADTARVWFNTWHTTEGLTPDQFVDVLKSGLSNYSEYKLSETPIFEMVVTDEGDKWVYCWFLWSAKAMTGSDVAVPVHISAMVKNGKIVYQAAGVNLLPGYLATQPADSTATAP